MCSTNRSSTANPQANSIHSQLGSAMAISGRLITSRISYIESASSQAKIAHSQLVSATQSTRSQRDYTYSWNQTRTAVSTVSLLLSISTRRRFYLQRSGQAVITGVVPSPRRYVLSLLSRIGFSVPTARRFSGNFAHSSSRAIRYSIFIQEKVPTSMCTR